MHYIKQLFHFGYQQALACLFPGLIFITLAVTNLVSVPGIPRYDVILIICLLIQVVMVKTGLETIDELKVITLFHIIGLTLEIYKVHMGSWSYPGEGYSKVAGVPLYSGFMYASVASYMVQAWRRLDLKIDKWPYFLWTVPLGAAIYLNFFTHHFVYDIRWFLTGALFIIFWKTVVHFNVNGERYKMPLSLSFFLIGFFIWVAENISTLLDGYRYPNQGDTWELVHVGKISSWFLLVVVSFIIVAQLKRIKGEGFTDQEVKPIKGERKKVL
ncbi:DUF817 domain-containing protein [Tenuibacillus multivorans]|uniref:Uncharacterized membrane protein YoaT, DUF817 family n=1 Tax=Tenuibacillus multivorans TaxID=237069 RepID=A0A1H0EBA1_9BACI|nr:DUF817 domain-containing protein [Tenuibacillus multivorans]GEL78741.1 hypothetical protein TMU01_29760 [Tenuibacillus multivorans]SDN79672.1 Uncharacterized membrane protein YoaT, DUF817 family [Tenuibacillus multivorans]